MSARQQLPPGFESVLADLEAEQISAGVALSDPAEYAKLAGLVDPQDFAEPLFGLIFRLGGEIIARGERASVQGVAAALRDQVNGVAPADLASAIRLASDAAELRVPDDHERAARTVRNLADRRRLKLDLEQAVLSIGNLDQSLEEIVGRIAKQNGHAAPGGRLRLVSPSEMDWRGAQLNLVKGILGFGMMALLYGESGSAKTLIALSLALHVALGRNWCGRKVKRGFVAYLAPEGGHSVHLRFHAWCRHHGIDPADDTVPFRTVPVRIDLCKSNADLDKIVANIKAAEPELGPCVLAVVDTVSRALDGGNENAPDDMGRFVANCDRLREATGATVLGVHHTPKDGDSPRGHTCLKNGSEIRMLAKKVGNGLFSLKLEHLKDGAAGDELLFELASAIVGTNDDGEEVQGGLVTETDIRPAGAGGNPHGNPTERQLRILQELRKEAATAKKWEFSTDEFRGCCIRSGAVDGDKPENAQRARCSDLRTQLANRGWITVAGDVIRLVS